MVAVRGGLGCEVSISVSHKPSEVLLFLLSTGVFSGLKMMTSFFVKSAEQLESHSFLIERRLTIFRIGYVWACVAVDVNIGRGRCPESAG